MSEGKVEVIVGRERRRRWSLQEKLRIVAESEEPGSSVRTVAARHDVYPSLLHTWRRHARNGRLSPLVPARFVPLRVVEAASNSALALTAVADQTPAGSIDITLPNGSRVRVDQAVNLAALRRVIAALRG